MAQSKTIITCVIQNELLKLERLAYEEIIINDGMESINLTFSDENNIIEFYIDFDSDYSNNNSESHINIKRDDRHHKFTIKLYNYLQCSMRLGNEKKGCLIIPITINDIKYYVQMYTFYFPYIGYTLKFDFLKQINE